jgi:hypothetical protein
MGWCREEWRRINREFLFFTCITLYQLKKSVLFVYKLTDRYKHERSYPTLCLLALHLESKITWYCKSINFSK